MYVINRSPTKVLTQLKTPFEMWNVVKPDLFKLKIFGFEAYVWIPDFKRKNFDPKSKAFVGYCPNGYRLWGNI